MPEPADPSQPLFIITQCASREQAADIARALLSQRLVACASIGAAVTSSYFWKGALEHAEEFPLTLKTLRHAFPAVAREIRRLHSYDVPEIVAQSISEVDDAYLRWLLESVAFEN